MTHLEYSQLVIEANRLGRRMNILHDQVSNDLGIIDEDYDGELDALAFCMFGIAEVLELLRNTPNAYLNTEAMAAIRDAVESAARLERTTWATEIFDHIDA